MLAGGDGAARRRRGDEDSTAGSAGRRLLGRGLDPRPRITEQNAGQIADRPACRLKCAELPGEDEELGGGESEREDHGLTSLQGLGDRRLSTRPPGFYEEGPEDLADALD